MYYGVKFDKFCDQRSMLYLLNIPVFFQTNPTEAIKNFTVTRIVGWIREA